MRKGIMSLLGGGKPRAKQKSKNMQNAEQAAVKPPVMAEELKVETKAHEKPFVQTINVPKQFKSTKRRMGMGIVKPRNKSGKK